MVLGWAGLKWLRSAWLNLLWRSYVRGGPTGRLGRTSCRVSMRAAFVVGDRVEDGRVLGSLDGCLMDELVGIYPSGRRELCDGGPRFLGTSGFLRRSARMALMRSVGSSPVRSMSMECGPIGCDVTSVSSAFALCGDVGFGALARANLGVRFGLSRWYGGCGLVDERR